MKSIALTVFLTLALSACTGLAEKNPSANPFPTSTDKGLA
jgi:hypothetical protein